MKFCFFILSFALLLFSCTNSPSHPSKEDSAARTDSIAAANAQSKADSSAAISPPKEIDKNDFPFFSTYPVIKSQGKSVTDFIPDGWIILDSVFADLNKDSKKDIAMVLQKKDSVRLIDMTNDYVDTLLTQPRILVVILRDNSNSNFYLSVQNHSFIPNHDSPFMEDPFEEMKAIDGVLQFDIKYFANAGSYEVSDLSYKFRYDKGDFILIGGEYMDFMRNSGEEEECSYNFLTKRMKITTGGNGFDPNQKAKETWETFELPIPKTLDKMKPPGTWEVKKGHYL